MEVFKKPVVLIALIVLIAWFGFLHMSQNHSNIRFVNMKQVISQPIEAMAKRLTKSQQLQFVKLYTKALPSTLKEYGKQNHVDLITATTLYDVSGVDVTQDIININLEKVEGSHA
jgi:conjugal transfer pilin signal peptidase TrbI